METAPEKPSPFGILSSFLLSADGSPPETRIGIALATSVALLLSFVFFVFVRRSPGEKVEPPKHLSVKTDRDADAEDDGKKKVVVFFGTQTGTAEGFAKVRFVFGS